MSDFSPLAAELERARAEARLAMKQRYRRLVGLGTGSAGLAAALAGLPMTVTLGLWAFGAAAWAILKAV
ncbi:MAG: hypothetical protein AB7M12_09705 [Hyphomonadaceae bacterium]